ncbi:MAG TPA: alpha/beta hydrolase [Chloroflexota bacterium]
MQQASRPHYAPITLCVAFDGFRLDTIDTGEATVRVRYGGNDFTVIAPDLRGYGDSSKPPTTTDHEPYSKRAMARDMVALLDHFGFPTFGVAGHDRGGRVASSSGARLPAACIAPGGAGHPADQRALPTHGHGRTGQLTLRRRPPRTTCAVTCSPARSTRRARTIAPARRTTSRGQLPKWYEVLAVWRNWANDVRGRGIDSGHYLAEEAPDETYAEPGAFFRG